MFETLITCAELLMPENNLTATKQAAACVNFSDTNSFQPQSDLFFRVSP
jgi:hypothetical protein